MRSVMIGWLVIAVAACAPAPDPQVEVFPTPGVVPPEAEVTPPEVAAEPPAMWPEDEARPTFRTDMHHYEPGAPVQLTLENVTGAAIGQNLCVSVVERRVGMEWIAVELPEPVCPMVLETLDPGAQATFSFPLEPLEAGEYRFRTTLERLDAGDRRDVVTEPFHVGPMAEPEVEPEVEPER